MDGQRFDRMTRVLGEGKSRRTMLQTVAATMLAGGLGRLGLADAAAACKESGETCRRNKQCCSKRCKQGRCRCRKNGQRCANGSNESCCSSFCTTQESGEQPTCCVPNEEKCRRNSDCCQNAANPAECQNKRCCVKVGGTCATPNGFQTAECCGTLGCDTNGTHKCVPTLIAP